MQLWEMPQSWLRLGEMPQRQAAPGGGGQQPQKKAGHVLRPAALQPNKERALGAQPGPSWMVAGNSQSCLPPQLLGTIVPLRWPIVSSNTGT